MNTLASLFTLGAMLLLPGVTLALFMSMLLEACPALPSPFIDPAVLPWFLLSCALLGSVVILPAAVLVLRILEDRREADEIYRTLSGRREP